MLMNIPAIVAELGRVYGDLVLVDDFLNHRVDPIIIDEIGRQIAERFADLAPDLIVTAEASGIPPAMATARYLQIPVVSDKKYVGFVDRYTFARDVVSPTKGTEYRVEVARRDIEPGGRALRLEYGAVDGAPASVLLSCRLQDLLGVDTHPTLGRQRVAVVVELLSPAGRPLQRTTDLPGFWRGSYTQVRGEMRGRYPKHRWPEKPWEDRGRA